jgi:hypothetical protein
MGVGPVDGTADGFTVGIIVGGIARGYKVATGRPQSKSWNQRIKELKS